jgi:antirestriction protein ArdC
MTERYRPSARSPQEGGASITAEQASREQRVAQALSLLEQGIERVMSEEGFADYLRAMSRFHEYSYANILLIRIQRPTATRVAGYKRWQSLERQVRKGEKGIAIFVPHIVKDRENLDEQGKPGERIAGYGTGYVFDISQTEGKPLPLPPLPEMLSGESERAKLLSDCLERFAVGRGATVERDPSLPANGVYYPAAKKIVVNAALGGDQATKTLCHEVAHFVADHTTSIRREDAETVAESAAFVVLRHFGLDTSQYSFPYVAAWAADKQVLQQNLGAIQQASHLLITEIRRFRESEWAE